MRRYSPIIILSMAIGCAFTLSKVYQPQHDVQQEQKISNLDSKDIALSSIKESFNILLNFDVNLRKKKKEDHTKNSNQKENTQINFDTLKKDDVKSTPILMLDNLVKKNF